MATPRTWSAGRCATCSWGRAGDGLGPDDLGSARDHGELFPGAVYENQFGTVAVRSRGPSSRRRRDHDLPIRPRLRRLPAAASSRVRRLDRGGPGASRLHRQCDGVGCGTRQRAAVRRPVRRPGRPRGAHAPSGRRPRDAVRGGRAAHGPGGPAGGDTRLHDRARHARRDRVARRARPPPVGRAHRGGDAASFLQPRCRPSGSGCSPTPVCSLTSRPSWRRSGACPQNKVPGEDLWDHTLRAVDGAVSEPTRIRLAALLHDLGKPSTMADGRFVGHEIVGAQQARDGARSLALAGHRAGARRPSHPPPHVRVRADLVRRCRSVGSS